MKTVLTIAAAIAALAFARDGAAQPAAGASQICATEGAVTFLCGPSRPEDLFHIPRTDWIVSSSMDGGLHLIDVNKKTSSQLYPSPAARDRLDKANYPTCQGPPDAAEKASFSTIGISMRVGKAGVHTLYAIRYPTVSRVHVFELDVTVNSRQQPGLDVWKRPNLSCSIRSSRCRTAASWRRTFTNAARIQPPRASERSLAGSRVSSGDGTRVPVGRRSPEAKALA